MSPMNAMYCISCDCLPPSSTVTFWFYKQPCKSHIDVNACHITFDML